MTFTLGIFDLYTYLVPGAAALTVLGYLGVRLDKVDPVALGSVQIVLLLVVAALLSFVVGHVLNATCALLDRIPLLRWDLGPAREIFLRRNPQAADRPFLDADTFLLQSAAELHNRDVALTISQVRAQGLMLRNLALPAALGALTALVELVVGHHRLIALVAVLLLGPAAVLLSRQSRVMRSWAVLKTLELCYWIPDIDKQVAAPAGTR